MSPSITHDWQTANHQALAAALASVKKALQRRQGINPTDTPVVAAQPLGEPSALETCCSVFGLTAFERDILLLCAGVELDASFVELCGTGVTLSLALTTLPDAHWSAVLPISPLRYWRLIEIKVGETLVSSPLRIDERILHYLTGLSYCDDRLFGLLVPILLPTGLSSTQQSLAAHLAELWQNLGKETIVQLRGGDLDTQSAIASLACSQLNSTLYRLRASDIPATLAEREALVRLWEREVLLSGCALLLDCEGLGGRDLERAARFVDRLSSSLVLVGCESFPPCDRFCLPLDLKSPSWQERRLVWQEALRPVAAHLNGEVDALAMQFNLSPQKIQTACWAAKWANDRSQPLTLNTLWQACRAQARSRLDDLAQRIEPTATWDDLILPAPQTQTLIEIAANLRQRTKVYETWGFSGKGGRGLGISALFAGTSGTGKTLAAEVLARELQLDLYHIDLSAVVSKYIGETEKNLRRVFDAAESSGAILLFDEADALFGKRSEVKDSHDRYANIEVSYLLQRMEAYRGLAILTTNLKSALDTAFLRRIRFIVQFPFPDATQRIEIWRRIFPKDMPREGLDAAKLGRLNVAGGNIRNIALNAAFLAADAGEIVQMKHLLLAAQGEYMKLEKSLTEAEVRGWV